MQQSRETNSSVRPGFEWGRNVLPAVVVGVVVFLLSQATTQGPRGEVLAQAPEEGDPLTTTPFNAAAQRNQMIDQLRMLNEKMTRMESRLSQPGDVRVKEMPAQQQPSVVPPPPAR